MLFNWFLLSTFPHKYTQHMSHQFLVASNRSINYYLHSFYFQSIYLSIPIALCIDSYACPHTWPRLTSTPSPVTIHVVILVVTGHGFCKVGWLAGPARLGPHLLPSPWDPNLWDIRITQVSSLRPWVPGLSANDLSFHCLCTAFCQPLLLLLLS